MLKEITKSEKLIEFLSASKNEARNEESNHLNIKNAKQINSSLHQLMKMRDIWKNLSQAQDNWIATSQVFWNCESTKSGTPLRFVLSKPGCSYENLIKFLSLFQKLPGANNETNSEEARVSLEAINLKKKRAKITLRCYKLVHKCIGEKEEEITVIPAIYT